MKFKGILIIGLLILAIFTLSSVSAGDINATAEELTVVSDELSTDFDESDNASSVLDTDGSDEVLGASDDDVLSGFSIDIGDEGVIYLDGIGGIDFEFPNNAKVDSYYYFYIDNKLVKKEIIDYKGCTGSVDLGKIDCGKHEYKIVYKTNKNVKVTKKGTFKVDWEQFELDHYYGKDDDYSIREICYGDSYRNSLVLPDDARGNVRVILNNKTHCYFPISEIHDMVISDLPIGRNEIVFEYSDSKYNGAKRAKDIVNVYAAVKGPDTISCVEPTVFTLKLPKDAKGTLIAHYPNHMTRTKVVNGTAKIKLPVLSAGNHAIYVWYNGSDYSVKAFGNVRYVDGLSVFDRITVGAYVGIPSEMHVGEDKYLVFKLPKDANGLLEINGEEFKLINGTTRIPLSKLAPDTYDFSIVYSGDSKYPDFDREFKLVVYRNVPVLNITLPNEIVAGTIAKITFEGPTYYKGSVVIYGYDESFSGDLKNGKTTVKSMMPKEYGNQSLVYMFYPVSDDYYSLRGIINYTAIPTPIIQAKDVEESYNGGTHVFKVRILDGYGKPVGAGEKVRAYGKVSDNAKGQWKKYDKVLKTDKNGYITIKSVYPCVNLYTFSYKGVESDQMIFCIHSVTWLFVNGQKVPGTVKKSSGIDVEVHLRSKDGFSKKLVANKKVKVKFNGKTYTLKTNSKGIAKFALKQKDIKKLKVGKKYTMIATYNKDLLSVVANVKFKVVN